MTDLELQQIQKIGANYSDFLGCLINELQGAEAQAHFLRMTLDAVLTQFVRCKGFAETAAFLRLTADHLDAENRRSAN